MELEFESSCIGSEEQEILDCGVIDRVGQRSGTTCARLTRDPDYRQSCADGFRKSFLKLHEVRSSESDCTRSNTTVLQKLSTGDNHNLLSLLSYVFKKLLGTFLISYTQYTRRIVAGSDLFRSGVSFSELTICADCALQRILGEKFQQKLSSCQTFQTVLLNHYLAA
jgi:hypothetical protein